MAATAAAAHPGPQLFALASSPIKEVTLGWAPGAAATKRADELECIFQLEIGDEDEGKLAKKPAEDSLYQVCDL